eukprot:357405-Chlamydomonas_euryale.AAC.4
MHRVRRVRRRIGCVAFTDASDAARALMRLLRPLEDHRRGNHCTLRRPVGVCERVTTVDVPTIAHCGDW